MTTTSFRVECVLQLKADTEAAAALIRGSNERRAADKVREEEEHEAEKDQLTAKGLNPYKARKARRACPPRTPPFAQSSMNT